jgi:hypothetical protein
LGKKETTKFDDWPLELGPHFTGVETQKYDGLFAYIVNALTLAFKILMAIKENPATFSLRTTILISGDRIGLVFPRGLPFKLVAKTLGSKADRTL